MKSIYKLNNIFSVSVTQVIAFWLVIFVVPSSFANEGTGNNSMLLQNSIAVLPFENSSPNPDDAYFAAGIYRNILNELEDIGNMNVIFPATVARFIGSDKSLPEIASELNVETVMKGNVSYSDNRFNISVQLIEGSSNKPLWSENYERDLSDVMAVQAEIIKNIAKTLGVKLSAAEQERIEKTPTASLEAYTHYLMAMQLYSAGPVKKPAFYQHLDQAIAADPKFALVHAIKANDYAYAKLAHVPVGASHGGAAPDSTSNNLSFEEMEKIALEHAGIALELNPKQAIAYKAQASIHRSNMNSPDARERYDRAFELSPAIYYSVSTLYYFSVTGDYDNAIKVAQRLLDLGPNVAVNHDNLGWVLLNAGNHAAAAEQYRLAIALKPKFHRQHTNLGLAEIVLGNNEEGLNQIRTAEQLQSSAGKGPNSLMAYGYARLGLKDDAMRVVNDLQVRDAKGEKMRPYARAVANLAIGEADKAYDILAQKPNEGLHYFQVMKSNMMKDPLLEEPRFIEIRNQSGW